MASSQENLMIGAGLNMSRQLGVEPDSASSNGSEIVQMPTGIPICSKDLVSISAGLRHSVFVFNDGKVLAAGDDRNDQIGGNQKKIYQIPTEVKISNEKIVQAACGQYYTAYLTENGQILIHGWRNIGQQHVVNLPAKFVFIAAGFDAPVAIDSEGALYIFDTYYTKEPIKVAGEKPFYDVAKGSDFILAIDVTGAVYGSGSLNNGSNDYKLFKKFENLRADRVFACYETGALLDNGKAYLLNSSHEFELVEAIQDKKIEFMDVGKFYCLFITAENELYGLGTNTNGELMLGKAEDNPVAMTRGPFQKMKLNFVKCGTHHSFAIVNGTPVEHRGAKAFNVK
ncbi:hypothetical protein TRFO_02351 [Tritrichomonas foetus]|uniref:Regulator of chromosome condensation n=1 Tax=Tritrichomonas foetus TaxID=1144522 RepID=A0A1J4J6M2_9EUKA|nr:hypothetical protein TRFO_02351 [Tritrichomonas foetus]|eukprot:OHS93831.1 hypothetical protein TRFO_02351 [Tritrichomonas foetus]